MNPLRIVFVSCAYATHRDPQPAWQAILDRVPTIDVLLLMGDNAYMSWDGPDWLHQDLAACYEKQAAMKTYQDVIRRAKMSLAIWDDHDAGPNNVCGAEWPDKIRKSRELFDRYMSFAANVGGADMWGAFEPAPGVRILPTDGRTHRTPPGVSSSTVLGHPQEQWLFDRLDEHGTGKYPIDIVVSGVGFSQGSSEERLNVYPFAKELDRRLRYRAGSGGAPGQDPGQRSLLLAGDIHRNFFAPQGTPKRPWYEVISSGVACLRPLTDMGSLNDSDNYIDKWGLLTIGAETVDIDFHGWTPPQKPKHKPEPRKVSIRIADWQVVSQA
jgi:hypothetical protein